MRKQMKNKFSFIPNLLSLIRLALVPVFLVLFETDYPRNLKAAMIVFVIAGITDVADGFLARHFSWESNMGRLLDPLADKLMQCTAILCLCFKRIIPIWFVIPYLMKELAMLAGGIFILKKKDIVVKSRWYGKAACVMFYAVIVVITIIILFSGNNIEQAKPIITVLCVITLVLTVAALVSYFVSYFINPKKEVFTNVPEDR